MISSRLRCIGQSGRSASADSHGRVGTAGQFAQRHAGPARIVLLEPGSISNQLPGHATRTTVASSIGSIGRFAIRSRWRIGSGFRSVNLRRLCGSRGVVIDIEVSDFVLGVIGLVTLSEESGNAVPNLTRQRLILEIVISREGDVCAVGCVVVRNLLLHLRDGLIESLRIATNDPIENGGNGLHEVVSSKLRYDVRDDCHEGTHTAD